MENSCVQWWLSEDCCGVMMMCSTSVSGQMCCVGGVLAVSDDIELSCVSGANDGVVLLMWVVALSGVECLSQSWMCLLGLT
jgi:hypothetical protein